jgi:hypothetical protein
MAEVEIKSYRGLPCSTEIFKINGKHADVEEFGEGGDEAPCMAEPYGCGDYRFTPYRTPPAGVCERYGITEEEWGQIADGLSDVQHVGTCGWCV